MDEIIEYLKNDVLPEDHHRRYRIRIRSARYWLSPKGLLYRRSFTGAYLRCVHPSEVEGILQELHEGSCGSHAGGRSLSHRAITQGYWWPYMQKDALKFTRKCPSCQFFSDKIYRPAGELHLLTSPWPFAKWGLNLVGSLLWASGNRRYLVVATDYFTK